MTRAFTKHLQFTRVWSRVRPSSCPPDWPRTLSYQTPPEPGVADDGQPGTSRLAPVDGCFLFPSLLPAPSPDPATCPDHLSIYLPCPPFFSLHYFPTLSSALRLLFSSPSHNLLTLFRWLSNPSLSRPDRVSALSHVKPRRHCYIPFLTPFSRARLHPRELFSLREEPRVQEGPRDCLHP